MLQDTQQRLLATDPTQSFIVQAPAGSGKTELLTQRFLKLLAHVQQPEHIVALTFTKKAASEMKERIFAALHHAQTFLSQPAEARHSLSPHQQQTLAAAESALAQAEAQKWHIFKHPHRLRIMTIDSLCQRLNHAVPVLEKSVPFATIYDSPETLYEQAARNCIKDCLSEPTYQPALRRILTHLDNRQDTLIRLFCGVLASRDQWLETIFAAKHFTREDLEKPLQAIENHALHRLQQALPAEEWSRIWAIACEMAAIENNPQSPRYVLRQWDGSPFPSREAATGLAYLLLTESDSLRKGFDHHVGLLKSQCTNYPALKKASQELCAGLSQYPDFIALLAQIKYLPHPFYTDNQWEVLQALLLLLPLLVAELHICFQQANAVDFTEISQQANQALGDPDNPTDLTLYVDYTIHHLLIDEFQDTSLRQMELIEKIVYPWLDGDGKTLFVVGDPMQSIYRFRQAEVGLFLKARQQGIGPVRLQPLELSSNFRSTKTIITWINQQFQHIFPKQQDIVSGAIAFHPSYAVIPSHPDSHVLLEEASNKQSEAQAIADLTRRQLDEYPEQSIAILVRSRSQLTEITNLFRQQQIPFQGIDINPLCDLAHLRDIWILTKVLLFPEERLFWIALLRTPFMGLPLADILSIAESKVPCFQLMSIVDQLSAEAQPRVRFLDQVMQQAFAIRHQISLVEWVIHTAKQLYATSIWEPSQHADLEQFWQTLEKHTQYSDYLDREAFEKDFASLYSQSSQTSAIQIMTIHKSKGLEFDCVIIPGVGNKSSINDTPLLRWLTLPDEHDQPYILISPLTGNDEEASPLYRYLGDIDNEKTQYELQRLLYVATTRAKKRLYLFDNQSRTTKGTFRHLLNHLDWPIQAPKNPEDQEEEQEQAKKQLLTPLLRRLPLEKYHHAEPAPIPTHWNDVAPITVATHARQFGIIAHELLQWICTYHPSSPDTLPWQLVTYRAREYGLDQAAQEALLHQLSQSMTPFFNDPIGIWISKAHLDEKNEFALIVNDHNQGKTRVIDRTFVDAGIRWIIDFKTGQDDETKQIQHRRQVDYYAKLLSENSPYPIHGGIYYLATQRWVHWTGNTQDTLYNPIGS